ncbi:MAG: hypothetical protein JW986_10465 [Methanotrichaceae archaeon]|nr:hypothetical protein [Methanotrichaceae archaeon]
MEEDEVDQTPQPGDSAAEGQGEMGRIFRKAIFFILIAVAALSTLGLFLSLNQIVDIWVTDRYAPLARAALYSFLMAASINIIRFYLIGKKA